MDAILYWKHAELGLVSFNDFVRFAESGGSMLSIGDWTLRQACQQFQKWESKENAPETIAVSVTLRQLENPHFIYKLSELLRELQFDPSCLILEISELWLSDRVILTDKTLSMLKQLGVRISMTDFGLGNLALRHLQRFSMDDIKIAKSLIENITTSKELAAIVKTMIEMAHTLKLRVIVSGVENQEQAQLLKDLGCNLMQGALFGKPMLAEEFDAVLEKA
jgi:EAL domain-containing protein (putative c-di-GMP-specific phosphodiesterase class I)